MRIAVDAMGGDRAPAEIVRGAVEAARRFGHRVLLVGQEEAVRRELGGSPPDGVEVEHAPEVIGMEEKPAEACQKKPNSSLMAGLRRVADGSCDAFFSAGNSGAVMAAGLKVLGRVRGVARPAIAVLMPSLRGMTLILDMGANVDCQPRHLLQFAVMGSIYCRHVLGMEKPRVGLLSIGSEPGKGNELSLAAYELLRASPLNFVGNIEGYDIPRGAADVVVCDGFVGNVVLKFAEGLAETLMRMLRERIKRNPIRVIASYLLLRGVFREIAREIEYDEYGGAPLLGLNGTCIIGHGGSNAKAVMNGIRVAAEAAARRLHLEIEKGIEPFAVRTAAQPNAAPA